jgi:hypothetical protein
MGRFLSQKDMYSAKYALEAFNSALKRGDVEQQDKIIKLHHVVCGCGVKGCIFISATRTEPKK